MIVLFLGGIAFSLSDIPIFSAGVTLTIGVTISSIILTILLDAKIKANELGKFTNENSPYVFAKIYGIITERNKLLNKAFKFFGSRGDDISWNYVYRQDLIALGSRIKEIVKINLDECIENFKNTLIQKGANPSNTFITACNLGDNEKNNDYFIDVFVAEFFESDKYPVVTFYRANSSIDTKASMLDFQKIDVMKDNMKFADAIDSNFTDLMRIISTISYQRKTDKIANNISSSGILRSGGGSSSGRSFSGGDGSSGGGGVSGIDGEI
ncbi:hypothetical protein [Francisella philomiragia]|uniref:hypothetical protein n=1 Tax=Francisella philomiragia TaxID=28110 RepID=UPI0019032B0B|nr:hypothetical protein [Francisella philomiragia]MBK2268292.1 hypothetical protein [Francisella philomiragia]MBK2279713.1 hypothetical protein [Francisella philomiragia]MBK2287603.1 hypothetical protein [Francisella philomiragia]MBK2289582.1 hypothetical protein [Francisella philomiragia]MBK2291480.1 hypothetical protein [Francisella philomiragia]